MENLYTGITQFCTYWKNAPTLQATYISLCSEVNSKSDGCIDAAKSMVECACRVLISELDDPTNPIKNWADSPIKGNNLSINNLLAAVVQLLKLSDARDDPFNKVISQHNKLATELNNFRNLAGTLSHGKYGFSETLSTHHRKSAVLSADAIVLFLHEAYLERQLGPINSRVSFSDQSAAIDKHCVFFAANVDDEDYLRVKIALPNRDVLELPVRPSELLFLVDPIAFKSAFNACNGLVDDEEADEERVPDQ